MSISSISRTSAPARRSGPTIPTSSRSTSPGEKERRSASLPPAPDDREVGPERERRVELARAHPGRQQVAAAEVEHLKLQQRRRDAVDPREVAVAVDRLAHALGDAVAEHREAPPGRAAQQCRQLVVGQDVGVVEGDHRRSFVTSHSAVAATANVARVQNA